MKLPSLRAIFAIVCTLSAAWMSSCALDGGGGDVTGSVSLKLRASDAARIEHVTYDVSGNGLHRTGDIDVSHSTTASTYIGGIPVGLGYTLTLDAVDVSGAGLTCHGSSTFNIVRGMTTLTTVNMRCHVPPRTGGLLVNGTLNICPTIDAIAASPAEVMVGYPLSLAGAASDLDGLPSTLSYAWTSATGAITGASSQNAAFTCTAVGTASITLTVTDGDCPEVVSITVTCSPSDAPPADAGSPEMDAGPMPTPALVVINEVESSGGSPGDWVELYNAGETAADLSGYVFKDSDDTHAYVLPAGTTLPPLGRIVLDEATFLFGLGAADSARLFDTTATLVDAYAWTSHAATTYGRCPDGSGAFGATTMATKGAANSCGLGMGPGTGTTYAAWPTTDSVVPVDVANTFGANLSDVTYQPAAGSDPAILWAVQNNPSRLFRIAHSGATWGPSAGEWATGKQLRYPSGLGSPDAEGVTKAEWSSSAIYVAAERDNTVGSVSRLSVLRFDASTTGTELSATHEWDLTSELGAVAPNMGLEAIAWVPDTYLVSAGFRDEHTGTAYDPGAYAGHGAGVFFVALEGVGSLYAYALDHVGGGVARVATVASGLAGVVALSFDHDVGALWAHCDDACGNRSTSLAVDTTVGSATLGRFTMRRAFEPPATLGSLAFEGMAVTPESECAGGVKSVYFADDSQTAGHALRMGTMPCGALL